MNVLEKNKLLAVGIELALAFDSQGANGGFQLGDHPRSFASVSQLVCNFRAHPMTHPAVQNVRLIQCIPFPEPPKPRRSPQSAESSSGSGQSWISSAAKSVPFGPTRPQHGGKLDHSDAAAIAAQIPAHASAARSRAQSVAKPRSTGTDSSNSHGRAGAARPRGRSTSTAAEFGRPGAGPLMSHPMHDSSMHGPSPRAAKHTLKDPRRAKAAVPRQRTPMPSGHIKQTSNWPREMAELRAMGLVDDTVNEQLLRRHNGNVEAVADDLTSA